MSNDYGSGLASTDVIDEALQNATDSSQLDAAKTVTDWSEGLGGFLSGLGDYIRQAQPQPEYQPPSPDVAGPTQGPVDPNAWMSEGVGLTSPPDQGNWLDKVGDVASQIFRPSSPYGAGVPSGQGQAYQQPEFNQNIGINRQIGEQAQPLIDSMAGGLGAAITGPFGSQSWGGNPDIQQPIGQWAAQQAVPQNIGGLMAAAQPFAEGAMNAVGDYGRNALESGLGQQSVLPQEMQAATRFRNPLEVPPEGSKPYYTGIYPEDLQSIQQGGLRPGTALTDDKAIADAYAARRAELAGGQPTTLQFNMRPEDVQPNSYYYTSPNTQFPNELGPSMVGGGADISDEEIARLSKAFGGPEAPAPNPSSGLTPAAMKAEMTAGGVDVSSLNSPAQVSRVYDNWKGGSGYTAATHPDIHASVVPAEQSINDISQMPPEPPRTPVGPSQDELLQQSQLNLGLGPENQPLPRNSFEIGPNGELNQVGGTIPASQQPTNPYHPGGNFPTGGTEPFPGQNNLEPMANLPPAEGTHATGEPWQRNPEDVLNPVQGLPGPRELNPGSFGGEGNGPPPVQPTLPFDHPENLLSAEHPLHYALRSFVDGLNGLTNLATLGHWPILRQGLGTAIEDLVTHTPGVKQLTGAQGESAAIQAIGNLWKVLKNPDSYEAVRASLNGDPFVKAAADANFFHEGQTLNPTIVRRVLSKIPLADRSQASARIYLETLRKMTYANEAARLSASGITDDTAYKSLWNAVSDATGHGIHSGTPNIGGYNPIFSPQAMIGRFRAPMDIVLGSGNPLGAGSRSFALRQMLGLAGTAAAIDGVAKMTGANLNFGINSPLGKVQLGQSQLDPTGGYNSMFKFFAALQNSTRMGNKPSQDGILKAVTDYTKGQFGPAADDFLTITTGTDFRNKPADWKRSARDSLLPIAANSIYDAIQANGPVGVAIGAPSIGAMGVSTSAPVKGFSSSGGPKPWEWSGPTPASSGSGKKPWE